MSEPATLSHVIDTPPPGAGKFYEVVNGRVVEPPEMGALETWIATVLAGQLAVHFAGHGQPGRVAVETLFLLDPATGLQRRPDLAFVSFERWPRDRPVPGTAAWDVVPDLAVEVVSPNDAATELLEKLLEYFRAGVRQVWLIYPRNGCAVIHVSALQASLLRADDTIEGGDLLPGFRLRLGDLLNEAT
jgi:Uma2 family endonuclease